MDNLSIDRGQRYEQLLLRAFKLDGPEPALGADCRVYYLLYYIRSGADLRGTGYAKQFVEIKEHVAAALQAILAMELHRHERIALEGLLEELLHIYDEDNLDHLVSRALKASYRLKAQEDDEVMP